MRDALHEGLVALYGDCHHDRGEASDCAVLVAALAARSEPLDVTAGMTPDARAKYDRAMSVARTFRDERDAAEAALAARSEGGTMRDALEKAETALRAVSRVPFVGTEAALWWDNLRRPALDAIAAALAARSESKKPTDLRAAVEGLTTPTKYENDANGNWFTTDMEYGWDCGVEAVLALIPEGAVLVTEESLRDALTAVTMDQNGDRPIIGFRNDLAPAAILRHLREMP